MLGATKVQTRLSAVLIVASRSTARWFKRGERGRTADQKLSGFVVYLARLARGDECGGMDTEGGRASRNWSCISTIRGVSSDPEPDAM